MDEFRWMITSSLLLLLIHFTATTEKYSLPGNGVTLPCETQIGDEDECKNTIWSFNSQETLFEHGQIKNTSKSDRLSVTAKCSLVMKNVTEEDAGYYTCKQFNESGRTKYDQVYLIIVSLTEREDADKVTLICSVSKHDWCAHRVQWLFEGKGVTEDNKDMKTRRSECSVTVTFPHSFLKKKSKLRNLFKCNVTNFYKPEERPLTFSFQSSGGDATTSEPTKNNYQTKPGVWWRIVVVSVGVAALFIIVVVVITWKKTKGSKRQVNENMADPADVSYASVSFIKKSHSKDQVWPDDDDDEGHVVVYSTVKASSSSAGASTDPSSLYATINKPNQ